MPRASPTAPRSPENTMTQPSGYVKFELDSAAQIFMTPHDRNTTMPRTRWRAMYSTSRNSQSRAETFSMLSSMTAPDKKKMILATAV